MDSFFISYQHVAEDECKIICYTDYINSLTSFVMIQENNSTHWILGGALLLIGLFVIIALVLTRQQAATVTLDVTNSAPVVDLVKICAGDSVDQTCTPVASITTDINASKNYDIYATVSDENGTGDVVGAGVSLSLFRSGITLAGCDVGGETDNNHCYYLASAVKFGADVTNKQQYFRFDNVPVAYWADATVATSEDFAGENWVVSVTAKDTANSSHAASITKELDELTALTLPSAIDFGSGGSARANGFSSVIANNVDLNFAQAGNTDADAQIKLDTATLSCTVFGSANFPASAIKWESATGASDVDYASMTKTLTTSFADIDLKDNAGNSSAAIRRRNSESTAPSANASFGILVPNNTAGTCSGVVSVTSVKGIVTGGGA